MSMTGAAALSGMSALVTGGGSGIGLGCARRLVVDGAAVTICGRSEERLQAAAEELAKARADVGGTVAVAWVSADVTEEEPAPAESQTHGHGRPHEGDASDSDQNWVTRVRRSTESGRG